MLVRLFTLSSFFLVETTPDGGIDGASSSVELSDGFSVALAVPFRPESSEESVALSSNFIRC